MLIEFRVANFRSFGEEQALSLVASKDTAHQGNLIPGERFNLLKAAGLFGANASGKSNFVKAMEFMLWFVRTSATQMNLGDEIDVEPFRLGGNSQDQPSRFEVVLDLEGARYDYGFSAVRQRICEEWLTAYPQRRPQRWFHRRFDPLKGDVKWAFRGPLKGNAEKLLRERTRENGLVLSRGADLNVGELSRVFEWFRTRVCALDLSCPVVSRPLDLRRTSPESWNRAMRLLKDADMGVEDIHVSPRPKGVTEFLESIMVWKKIKGQAEWAAGATEIPIGASFPLRPVVFDSQIRSVHQVTQGGESVEFDFTEAESNGTQRFLALTGLWVMALENGTVVFVDELDCSLHPLLTRKLLQFFQDPRENTRGAQLVFVTHDTTLMDLSLLRRDQIWIVEKDAGHASRLFSLYDIDEKPRKGEAVEKRYLAGRYGGVPMFGPTLENLESP